MFTPMFKPTGCPRKKSLLEIHDLCEYFSNFFLSLLLWTLVTSMASCDFHGLLKNYSLFCRKRFTLNHEFLKATFFWDTLYMNYINYRNYMNYRNYINNINYMNYINYRNYRWEVSKFGCSPGSTQSGPHKGYPR